jgi:hypothetical protein
MDDLARAKREALMKRLAKIIFSGPRAACPEPVEGSRSLMTLSERDARGPEKHDGPEDYDQS